VTDSIPGQPAQGIQTPEGLAINVALMRDTRNFLRQVETGHIIGGVIIGFGPSGQLPIIRHLAMGLMQLLCLGTMDVLKTQIVGDVTAPQIPTPSPNPAASPQ
jgi:hypothetical protein